MSKLHIKKGDTVYVNAGEDKGKTGKVVKVLVDKQRAVVEGVNIVSKSQKPSAKAEINKFFTAMEERQRAEAAKVGEANAAAGKAFLEENGKRVEVKTTPSGLQYEVLKEGTVRCLLGLNPPRWKLRKQMQ